MFDRKSDYALNRKEPDAIICKSVSGVHIRLTRLDFDSPEEFEKWKHWSDEDYRDTESAGRTFHDHCVPLEEALIPGAPSAEQDFWKPMEEQDHEARRVLLVEEIRGTLTEKQYRRMYLYYLADMTETEIAERESVGQQRVSNSLASGRKILSKIFEKFLKDRG